jgi:hypothetical protein
MRENYFQNRPVVHNANVGNAAVPSLKIATLDAAVGAPAIAW